MQGNKNCVEECDEGCLNHPFESQYSIQPKLVRDTQLLIRNLIQKIPNINQNKAPVQHKLQEAENILSTLYSNADTELMFDDEDDDDNMSIHSMENVSPRPMRNQGLLVNSSFVGDQGVRSYRAQMNSHRQRSENLKNDFLYSYRTETF